MRPNDVINNEQQNNCTDLFYWPFKMFSLLSIADVAAYVEVRTGAENRSKAIISKLRQLGATVVDKLSDEVTHVVWKGGKKSTVDRARKRNIPVVTVLWVDR